MRISAFYLFAGIIWILVSDRLLALLAPDAATFEILQTYKGWFYVLMTALLLLAYLQSQLGRQEATARALKESEARFRSLTSDVLENAEVGMLIIDADSSIAWLNTTMENMFHVSREECLGSSCDTFLRSCLLPAVHTEEGSGRSFLESYSHLQPQYEENDSINGKLPQQPGQERTRTELLLKGDLKEGQWVEYSRQPILSGYYAGGRIEYFTDITQRKQAAIEIRRRVRIQEMINAVIMEGSQVSEPGRMLETALVRCMDVLGGGMGVIWAAGIVFSSGIPAGNAEQVQEDAQSCSPEEVTCTGCPGREDEKKEVVFRSLDPGMVKSSITAPIQAEGKVIGGVSLAVGAARRWTTEEKEILEVVGRQLGAAVERLGLLETTQEQAGQLQLILDTVQEGIITLNEERRILLANPAARRMLALLSDSRPGDVLERLGDRSIDDLLVGGPDPEPVLVSTTGPDRFFDVYSHRVGNGAADVSWTLLLREVTAMRQARERVIRQERRAAIGQLASGIAHDFNNILAAVILYSEMLLTEKGLTQRGSERLNMIIQQAERAARLTNQILDFSRTTAMELYPMDLLEFMQDVQRLLVRTLPENVELALEHESQQYIVSIDPNRMQQVFLNLALNARDAMPEGGQLTFSLRRMQFTSENLPLEGMQPGDWIRISTADTGCGMSEEVLDHLFEPFFSTKDPGEGTGLGLAQVDGIVKQLSGHVAVESEPGKGTVFHIYLPTVRFGMVPGIRHDVEAMLDSSKSTLLVVEDDSVTRGAVSELLESMGYEVLQAASGQEALDTFAVYGETIDLVLSDLVMPGIGGEELYDLLRARYPDLKMLVMTGYPLGENSRALLEKGVVAWLQKPVTSTNLRAALQSFFRDRNISDGS